MGKPNSTFSAEVTVFRQPGLPAEGAKPDPQTSYLAELSKNRDTAANLMPIADIELSVEERAVVNRSMNAQLQFGCAAVAPIICCKACPEPFRAPCELAQLKKEPIGRRCPYEQKYVQERFIGWMGDLGATLDTITEAERSTVASLAILDLEQYRCNKILADAQNAQLTSRAVRDVDAETGVPLCWEDVIHANALRIDQISLQRRMLLRDFELTPEMQTKKKKAMGQLKGPGGPDLASRQSDIADKLRRAQRREPNVVDVQ